MDRISLLIQKKSRGVSYPTKTLKNNSLVFHIWNCISISVLQKWYFFRNKLEMGLFRGVSFRLSVPLASNSARPALVRSGYTSPLSARLFQFFGLSFRLHSFFLDVYRSKSPIFPWKNIPLMGIFIFQSSHHLGACACVGFSFFVTCHVVWWWRHTLYHVIHTHAMWPLCHVVSMFTFRLRDSFFTFFRRLILRKKRLKLLLSHTWGCRLQKFQI